MSDDSHPSPDWLVKIYHSVPLEPACRKIPSGWEPVDAWKETEPVIPDKEWLSQEFLFWLIEKTIECGTPPKEAVKWWMYIVTQALPRLRREGRITQEPLLWDYCVFLYEKGIIGGEDLDSAVRDYLRRK